MLKKKVIALVVDTALTNKQIESLPCRLSVVHAKGDGETCSATLLEARNVRVLDSDEKGA